MGSVGVNIDCMRALLCALNGCDIYGAPRQMMNIVELRFEEGMLGLAQIDVSVSDLRDEGLEMLVDAMIAMKVELVVLKARKANLTSRTGNTLGRFLDECNDLEELWLGGNKLMYKGLKPLCQAVRNHPNLAVLDVSSNSIGVPGGEEIGALFTASTKLMEFDCSWNDIAAEDASFLLQGLSLNATIEIFRAAWNRFGKGTLPEIEEVLNREKEFSELDLRNCGLDGLATTYRLKEATRHIRRSALTPIIQVDKEKVAPRHELHQTVMSRAASAHSAQSSKIQPTSILDD